MSVSLYKEKVSILLFVYFLITFSLLIWSLNKGIDFTDESFYIIGYHFNIEPNQNISFFHKIYLTFFSWGNFTIPEIRLLRLLLTLLSTFFLSYSISNYFEIKNKIELFLFSINFSTLSYIFYPNSISYNTISSLLITIIIGLFFLLKNNQHKIKISFFIGFFSSLLILNKFTNIAFLIVITALFFFIDRSTIKKFNNKLFLFVSLSYSLGVFMGFYLIFESFHYFQESLNRFLTGLSLLDSHSTMSTLTSYYYGLVHIVSKSKWILLFTIVFLPFRKVLKYKNSLPIALPFLFFLLFVKSNYISEPIGFFIPYFIFIFGVIVLKLLNKELQINKLNIYSLFFILTPFLGGLGTNNSPYIHFIFYGAILGIGLSFLIKNYDSNTRLMFSLFLTLSLSIQFFSGFINHPYRLNSKLQDQTIEVKDIPALRGILVDSTTNYFIKDVEKLRATSSQYIFTLADYFIVSLILDKKPYPFYWLNSSNINKTPSIIESRINQNNLMIVIPNNKLIKKETQNALQKIGVNLSKNYLLIKSIEYNGEELLFYSFKENNEF